jgi:hypothetical protein
MIDQAERSQLLNEGALAGVPQKRHGRSMIPPFEVFQSEADGNVLWRGTAATLEDAKARIREFAAEAPGDFIIMSRRTGQKLIVPSKELDSIAEPSSGEI